MINKEKIILIGAGLAGPLLANYMAQRGYVVTIIESRPDMRKVPISAGRSINLALSARGIQALKEIGLYNRIKPIATLILTIINSFFKNWIQTPIRNYHLAGLSAAMVQPQFSEKL